MLTWSESSKLISMQLTVNHYYLLAYRILMIPLHQSYLSIIHLAGTEQRFHRIVARNHEASNIDEESTGDIEKDKEKVDGGETKKGIHLWNRGLFLQIVQERILR